MENSEAQPVKLEFGGTPSNSIPLIGVEIEAKIIGTCSQTQILQSFENIEEYPIEAM